MSGPRTPLMSADTASCVYRSLAVVCRSKRRMQSTVHTRKSRWEGGRTVTAFYWSAGRGSRIWMDWWMDGWTDRYRLYQHYFSCFVYSFNFGISRRDAKEWCGLMARFDSVFLSIPREGLISKLVYSPISLLIEMSSLIKLLATILGLRHHEAQCHAFGRLRLSQWSTRYTWILRWRWCCYWRW